MGIRPSLQNISKNNGKIVPELIGVNVASTFTGFCGYHDRELFLPIDNRPFSGSKEQIFLLAYRGFCREQYTKISVQQNVSILKEADKGKSLFDQVYIQNFMSDFALGNDAGVKDAMAYKKRLDDMLLSKDYSTLIVNIIEFSGIFPLQCSGCVYPTHDIENIKLQDLLNLEVVPDALFLNSFVSDGHGFVALSHFAGPDSAPARFIHSLRRVAPAKVGCILIQLAFKWFENIFIDPEWWESIPSYDRRMLEDFMFEAVHPTTPVRFDNFKDASWELPAVARWTPPID